MVEASQILPHLWQGSKPPEGSMVRQAGYSLLVLCAKEYQDASRYSNVEVVRAPNDDDPSRPPTREELQTAIIAARRVVQVVSHGKQALVTCRMGLNRSGLVTALSLHFLMGWSGDECIGWIRAHRHGTMRNPGFNVALRRLPARGAWNGLAFPG